MKSSLTVKINESICEDFRNYCEFTGVEQGKLVERIIKGFLDDKPLTKLDVGNDRNPDGNSVIKEMD